MNNDDLSSTPSAKMPKALETNGRGRGSRLGWIGVGLGIAEVAAPGAVARAIGLAADPWERLVLRAVGVRCLAVGFGSLRRSAPTAWRVARLASGLVDLGLLGLAFRGGGRRARKRLRRRLPLALGAMAGLAVVDIVSGVRSSVRARRASLNGAEPAGIEGAVEAHA